MCAGEKPICFSFGSRLSEADWKMVGQAMELEDPSLNACHTLCYIYSIFSTSFLGILNNELGVFCCHYGVFPCWVFSVAFLMFFVAWCFTFAASVVYIVPTLGVLCCWNGCSVLPPWCFLLPGVFRCRFGVFCYRACGVRLGAGA